MQILHYDILTLVSEIWKWQNEVTGFIFYFPLAYTVKRSTHTRMVFLQWKVQWAETNGQNGPRPMETGKDKRWKDKKMTQVQTTTLGLSWQICMHTETLWIVVSECSRCPCRNPNEWGGGCKQRRSKAEVKSEGNGCSLVK